LVAGNLRRQKRCPVRKIEVGKLHESVTRNHLQPFILHGRAMLSAKDMLKGPKGQKRPADVIGNAVHVMRIATGEIDETPRDDGKNAAAVALGRKGGMARAEKISKRRRAEIARKAAVSRWGKKGRA